MLNYQETQELFLDNIFKNKKLNFEIFKSNFFIDRFNIYRDTIILNLQNSLAITFPGTWEKLGVECANSVARLFMQNLENLPTTRCLDDWGEKFPEFLAGFLEEQYKNNNLTVNLDNLIYYSKYEWIKHKVYISPKIKPLSPEKINFISEENIEYIKLKFIPSLNLLKAEFNKSKNNKINKNKFYCFYKDLENNFISVELKEEVWQFVKLLIDNNKLIYSAENIINKYPEFDLFNSINYILTIGIVEDILNENS